MAPPDQPAGAIVLIGFMGAGKTSTARALAAELGAGAVDTDTLLEAELGMPVEAFFDRHGEGEFRAREEAVAVRVLEEAGPETVVSLGGGTVKSGRVRDLMRGHTVVLLEVEGRTAWQRASGRGRPLARDRDRFLALARERAALYEGIAQAILPTGDRALARRALPALGALSGAPAGTRMVWATSASGDYPVFLGEGLAAAGFAWPPDRRRFGVSDENVAPLVRAQLDACEHTVVLEPGEGHKTLASAERVWRELAAAGMAGDDVLLAVGGGVVGDLAGFCAATYQRGVRVVHVPTTLVAQVDSAYGGKTGVDLPEAKNYVGAYHQPSAVLADASLLASLPDAERAAGYAEVVKTALIAGGQLWERVREGATGLEPDVILACLRTKLGVVARDERDAGERQVLNLGHTIGHALETATAYERFRHGEAVGLGVLGALRLSGQAELRDEVSALLAARGLPVTAAAGGALDPDSVVAATQRDKKRRGQGSVPFVLVEAPGCVRHGCAVPGDELRAAVAELFA